MATRERESGGLVVGSMILTLEASVLIPGLLPSLLLLGVFLLLPLILLTVAAGALIAIPVAISKLVLRALRRPSTGVLAPPRPAAALQGSDR